MPALSGNFYAVTDYSAFLQQSVAVLSQPAQHFVESAQHASPHSDFLSQPAHLSSQHSVFSPQHESAHSAFLLLQHEHDEAAIIAATITIDIKTFFIVNLFKGLNKTLSHKIIKVRE